jgi:hypothetical protein
VSEARFVFVNDGFLHALANDTVRVASGTDFENSAFPKTNRATALSFRLIQLS